MITGFLLIILMVNCQYDGYRQYVVKAGHNYCRGVRFEKHNSNSLHFWFVINDDIFGCGIPGQIKITGMSDHMNPHKDSQRLTVRVNDEFRSISAYLYCYDEGISPQEDSELKKYICNLEAGTEYYCEMWILSGRVYCQIIKYGTVSSWQTSSRADRRTKGWMLYPNLPYKCDHDVSFKIKYK